MDDKNNDLQTADSNSSEAVSRAERIKAIKNSINKQGTNSEASNKPSSYEEQPVVHEKVSEVSNNTPTPNDTWESDIAERIAKRVQKVKNEKNTSTPESILSELENQKNDYSNNLKDSDDCTDNVQDDYAAEENVSHLLEPDYEMAEVSDELSDEAIEPVDEPVKTKKKKNKQKKTVKENLLGLFPQKKDSLAERIRKIIFLGSVTAIVVCGYIVADYYIDNARTRKIYEDLTNEYSNELPISSDAEIEPEDDGVYYTLLSGAEKLLKINNEVIGVINIPETEVNYPVMQSDDLEKYLHKNIMGDDAKAGALFLDYRNRFDHVVDGKITEQNSDNLIIYGHNMENKMMFGTLKNYRNDASYYGEHPVIELNSNYFCYEYKIFAFFIVDSEDKTDTAFEYWNKLNFSDETDFYDFVNEAKRRTIRLNDVDVEYGDKLLTLSTCNGIFGKDGPGRMVVMARLVREGEDPYEGTQNSTANPNIKWPSLYYQYQKNEKYDPDAEFVPYGETAAKETTTEE